MQSGHISEGLLLSYRSYVSCTVNLLYGFFGKNPGFEFTMNTIKQMTAVDVTANAYEATLLSKYQLQVAQNTPIRIKQQIKAPIKIIKGHILVAKGVIFGLNPIISIKVLLFSDSTSVVNLLTIA